MVIVTVDVPTPVGVPEITPVVGFRLNPVGSPEAAQVYGTAPPAPSRVMLYG
jgi:hypothetical protein